MEAAGIGPHATDPPGGRIVRDGRGRPTGVFVDNAQDAIEKAQPDPTRAQIKESITRALKRCAEAGLTEIHDAGVGLEDLAAYRELADASELPLRVYLMWRGIGDVALEPLVEQPPFINYRNRLTLRAVKLMIDGAMGSRGAVFEEDYADDRGNRGLLVTSAEEIERRATLAMRHGYQVCTHAIGDRGIRLTIDAYDKALAAVHPHDPRPRIEHLQCVRREDVPRLKARQGARSRALRLAVGPRFRRRPRCGIRLPGRPRAAAHRNPQRRHAPGPEGSPGGGLASRSAHDDGRGAARLHPGGGVRRLRRGPQGDDRPRILGGPDGLLERSAGHSAVRDPARRDRLHHRRGQGSVRARPLLDRTRAALPSGLPLQRFEGCP